MPIAECEINTRLRHKKFADKKELPAIANSHEQYMVLPPSWAGWGLGWRNSDHQARRDHRFLITSPPFLRKERPAGKLLQGQERAKPSPLANLPGTGPTQGKNKRLSMMIRIPPARSPCPASLLQEFFGQKAFFSKTDRRARQEKGLPKSQFMLKMVLIDLPSGGLSGHV